MQNRHTTGAARPLYVQVRERLIERIRSGIWKPGQLIPNEFQIARELGVSQGTARKALDALAGERLVVRRQGLGTFVVEHTPAHMLFRFFNLFDEGGDQILPDSRDVELALVNANKEERVALALSKGARVFRITRTRIRSGKPFISEMIALPETLFPNLAACVDLPNTLYDMFQKSYGVFVVRIDERITAVAARGRAATALGLASGTPLLKIDRIAYGFEDQPIEWRVSHCRLIGAYYLARLR
jgi:GntR family transcriptional regulator